MLTNLSAKIYQVFMELRLTVFPMITVITASCGADATYTSINTRSANHSDAEIILESGDLPESDSKDSIKGDESPDEEIVAVPPTVISGAYLACMPTKPVVTNLTENQDKKINCWLPKPKSKNLYLSAFIVSKDEAKKLQSSSDGEQNYVFSLPHELNDDEYIYFATHSLDIEKKLLVEDVFKIQLQTLNESPQKLSLPKSIHIKESKETEIIDLVNSINEAVIEEDKERKKVETTKSHEELDLVENNSDEQETVAVENDEGDHKVEAETDKGEFDLTGFGGERGFGKNDVADVGDDREIEVPVAGDNREGEKNGASVIEPNLERMEVYFFGDNFSCYSVPVDMENNDSLSFLIKSNSFSRFYKDDSLSKLMDILSLSDVTHLEDVDEMSYTYCHDLKEGTVEIKFGLIDLNSEAVVMLASDASREGEELYVNKDYYKNIDQYDPSYTSFESSWIKFKRNVLRLKNNFQEPAEYYSFIQ